MKKGIKMRGMRGVVLVLTGLLSIAGIAGAHMHVAAATRSFPSSSAVQQAFTLTPHSCTGAEIATTNGTVCLSPGSYKYLTGVTQICNTNQYPVNFVGSSTTYVIYPGNCQSINPDNGTVYVDG